VGLTPSVLEASTEEEVALAIRVMGRAKVDSRTRTATTRLSSANSLKVEEAVLIRISAHSLTVRQNYR